MLIVPALTELCRAIGAPVPRGDTEAAALVARADVQALYERLVNTVNEPLAQFERIKRVALLPRELTVERGELTPTLKVKRRVIEEAYKPVIDGLYA